MESLHGTTVLAVRRNSRVVIGGDGQVTLGGTVMKGNARKVRRLYQNKIIAGFAGGTADAFTLFERFEGKLEKHGGNRLLRRLEALLIVADLGATLILSGNGDVVEPERDLAAIGSGGAYAQAAAQALLEHTSLDARTIVEQALKIAAGICIYTNENLTLEELAGE